MTADALLKVSGVYAGYGRGDIIYGIDLEARESEIATIIGPNGAGKSTAIKAVAGLVRMREGSIRVGGDEIGGLAVSVVAQRGVSFEPQMSGRGSGLFSTGFEPGRRPCRTRPTIIFPPNREQRHQAGHFDQRCRCAAK